MGVLLFYLRFINIQTHTNTWTNANTITAVQFNWIGFGICCVVCVLTKLCRAFRLHEVSTSLYISYTQHPTLIHWQRSMAIRCDLFTSCSCFTIRSICSWNAFFFVVLLHSLRSVRSIGMQCVFELFERSLPAACVNADCNYMEHFETWMFE